MSPVGGDTNLGVPPWAVFTAHMKHGKATIWNAARFTQNNKSGYLLVYYHIAIALLYLFRYSTGDKPVISLKTVRKDFVSE